MDPGITLHRMRGIGSLAFVVLLCSLTSCSQVESVLQSTGQMTLSGVTTSTETLMATDLGCANRSSNGGDYYVFIDASTMNNRYHLQVSLPKYKGWRSYGIGEPSADAMVHLVVETRGTPGFSTFFVDAAFGQVQLQTDTVGSLDVTAPALEGALASKVHVVASWHCASVDTRTFTLGSWTPSPVSPSP